MTTKIWGNTQLIFANDIFSFHRIEFNKGYKCSEHKHAVNWNGFFVESGKLLISIWQDTNPNGLVQQTILETDQFLAVEPGKIHQFEGLETGVAFELYWSQVSHDDIIRRTAGTKVL